jgi:hypothetical protein
MGEIREINASSLFLFIEIHHNAQSHEYQIYILLLEFEIFLKCHDMPML